MWQNGRHFQKTGLQLANPPIFGQLNKGKINSPCCFRSSLRTNLARLIRFDCRVRQPRLYTASGDYLLQDSIPARAYYSMLYVKNQNCHAPSIHYRGREYTRNFDMRKKKHTPGETIRAYTLPRGAFLNTGVPKHFNCCGTEDPSTVELEINFTFIIQESLQLLPAISLCSQGIKNTKQYGITILEPARLTTDDETKICKITTLGNIKTVVLFVFFSFPGDWNRLERVNHPRLTHFSLYSTYQHSRTCYIGIQN